VAVLPVVDEVESGVESEALAEAVAEGAHRSEAVRAKVLLQHPRQASHEPARP
jgi:hypothetical protein